MAFVDGGCDGIWWVRGCGRMEGKGKGINIYGL